jgi:hypothetical protein
MAVSGTNKYQIIVSASIDQSKTGIDSIQESLNKISSKITFKIMNISVDTVALNGVKTQVENALSNIKVNAGGASGGNSPGGGTIGSNMDAISTREQQLMRSGYSVKREVISSLSEGMMEPTRAILTYQKGLDEAVKETYVWKQAQDGVNGELAESARWVQEIQKDTKDRPALLKKEQQEMAALKRQAEQYMNMAKVKSGAKIEAGKGVAGEMLTAVNAGDLERARELAPALRNASDQARALGKNTLSYTESIKTAVVKTVQWATAMTLVYGTLRQLQQGIQYIKDLNKEMTTIQIVTGATKDQVAELALGYNSLGKELGVSTLEIAKGSLEWARQGKTAKETQELLRASVIMGKLANMEQAQSTEYMTSILNGFQMGTEDAIGAVDKLVAVDNAAATSVAELASALQRSANSAKQTGVSFEELVSYVGTVSSVTRKSAESIGKSNCRFE